jgi:pentatricopeptide repeat protein
MDFSLIDSIAYLVHAYGLNGKGKEALELFGQISEEMIDHCSYVCVLNACSHSGLIEEGEMIFNRIPRDQRTEEIYTSMVSESLSLIRSVATDELTNRSTDWLVHFNSIERNV